MSITWLWLKKEIISWLKEPAAVLLNMAYPLLMMLFMFVVGGDTVRNNPDTATPAVALLGLTGVMMVGINLPANGINEIRGSDYYYYLRTLPVGTRTRLIAWSGAPVLLGTLSGGVALAVGASASAAHYTIGQTALLLLLYCVFGICCTILGVLYGFILSKKSSLAVSLGTSFLFLLLTGGKSIATLPAAIDTVARYIPSTAAVQLGSTVMGEEVLDKESLVVILMCDYM